MDTGGMIAAARHLGTVTEFHHGRDFGYINADERIPGAVEDIYVHASEVKAGSLKAGDRVSFGLCGMGFEAINVVTE